MPEHDLVDILGGDPGVGQRLAGHPHDQAFDAFAIKLTEGGMRPTDDCCGHRCLPIYLAAVCRTLVALVGNAGQVTMNSAGGGAGFASQCKA